tara:strand:- start:287 stop:544 length:258 start_codon:yes stop_codon:yes gene_type:complete
MELEKVEVEELGKLRSLHDANNGAKDAIAYLEIKVNRLQSQKQNLLNNFDLTEASLDGYESELTEKYGEGLSINLSDGAITRPTD